jgi:PEP-CTERM motif
MRQYAIQAAGLLAAVFLAGQPAGATTYDFTYTFDAVTATNYGGPYVVSGSFDGVDDGTFVTGITNISAALDGVSFSGPLYIHHYQQTLLPGEAVVSFVGSNNVFAIAGCADLSFVCSAPDWFNMRQPVAADQTASAFTGYLSNSFRYVQSNASDSGVAGVWNLSVNAVPEPSTNALLAIGLIGLGLWALRRSSIQGSRPGSSGQALT